MLRKDSVRTIARHLAIASLLCAQDHSCPHPVWDHRGFGRAHEPCTYNTRYTYNYTTIWQIDDLDPQPCHTYTFKKELKTLLYQRRF